MEVIKASNKKKIRSWKSNIILCQVPKAKAIVAPFGQSPRDRSWNEKINNKCCFKDAPVIGKPEHDAK